MRSLQSLLFPLLMCIAVTAHALDQDVQIDLLMAKIIKADKEGKSAEVLPAYEQLESMEPSMKKPLPESFHFFYIDTLDKSGNRAKALSRGNLYLERFGKKGKHYGEVIEIVSRLQMQAAQEEKVAAEKKDREAAAYKSAHDAWLIDINNCQRRHQNFYRETNAWVRKWDEDPNTDSYSDAQWAHYKKMRKWLYSEGHRDMSDDYYKVCKNEIPEPQKPQ